MPHQFAFPSAVLPPSAMLQIDRGEVKWPKQPVSRQTDAKSPNRKGHVQPLPDDTSAFRLGRKILSLDFTKLANKPVCWWKSGIIAKGCRAVMSEDKGSSSSVALEHLQILCLDDPSCCHPPGGLTHSLFFHLPRFTTHDITPAVLVPP